MTDWKSWLNDYRFCGHLNGNFLSGGTINVLVAAREDWTPSEDSSSKVTAEPHEFSVRIKGRRKDDALDSDQQLQADWIRRYMEQQEEVCGTNALQKIS